MSEVLRVSGLGRAFGDAKALEGVSFALDRGERLAVLGRSGSGKTTLLRLIAGLESPTEGDVAIAGKAASRAGQVLIAPERRGGALVFQGLALFPNLRALDQSAFAARGLSFPPRKFGAFATLSTNKTGITPAKRGTR